MKPINKKRDSVCSVPGKTMAITLIFFLALLITSVIYIIFFGKQDRNGSVVSPAAESKCAQKVKFDPMCPRSMLVYGYEYDESIGSCKAVNAYGGCSLETPFNSMEECQKECEDSSKETTVKWERIF